MATITVENGFQGRHLNGVDNVSVEEQFFEDISEAADETISQREAELSIREEDLPVLEVQLFSDEERNHLEAVIQRYSEIYECEGERQQQLRKSLDTVSMKELEDSNSDKNCHFCGESLNFILNPGKPCAQCTYQFCAKKCLKLFRDGETRMCEVCYREDVHEGQSGKWFMVNLQKSGRSPIFGTDVLRASLRRAKEDEEQRRLDEQHRAMEAEAVAVAAAATAAALSDDAHRTRLSVNAKSDGGSSAGTGSGLKWKFGKKHKKSADFVDSASNPNGVAENIHNERPVDVSSTVTAEVPPSVVDSDQVSSFSHAVPPPPAIEIEEGVTVSDMNENLSITGSSYVPTVIATSDDGASWKDTRYVSEENHIFPEDEPENEYADLRVPSHMKSQESVLSIYSDSSAGYRLAVDVTGEVLLGIDYDFKHNIFLVNVKQCRDIAAVDTKRKKSDPYVKTYLLPDKTKVSKRKTSYRKNTLNPIFDEQLKYVIAKSELETRVLSVAIWHRVAFGHNIFLGEANVPLEDYEFGDPTAIWYPLHEKRDIAIPMPLMMYKGDLILAVKYIHGSDLMNVSNGRGAESRGEVHVWIKEAKNLVAARPNGYSDPFCKGYLLPDKSKSGKKKTRVIKRNLNPAWNTVLRFTDVDEENLPDRSVELTIWDYGRFSSNEFLGGLRLNLGLGVHKGQHVKWMDSKGHEITMWQAMISRPNTWIEGTLMLRPNMD